MSTDSSKAEGYRVTPLGAFTYCSAAFGAAVLAVSLFSYRRNLSRLKAEGFSDEDVNRAMPYAIKGLGIATASVGGVGIVFSGIVYMSGVDIKQQAQVSSFKDAWAMLAGKNFGRALAGKVQAMMGVSEHKAVNPDHKAEGGQAEPK